MTKKEITRRFKQWAQQTIGNHCSDEDVQMFDNILALLEQEPLTDREQRIFLSAMGREEKVCREVDAEHPSENYEDTLLAVCRSITRKVKGVLWEM